jgi:peptide/nickel transport system permease protein
MAGRLVRGDLGVSIFTNLPGHAPHRAAHRATLSLTVCTLVISVLVAVPLGVSPRRARAAGSTAR